MKLLIKHLYKIYTKTKSTKMSAILPIGIIKEIKFKIDKRHYKI